MPAVLSVVPYTESYHRAHRAHRGGILRVLCALLGTIHLESYHRAHRAHRGGYPPCPLCSPWCNTPESYHRAHRATQRGHPPCPLCSPWCNIPERYHRAHRAPTHETGSGGLSTFPFASGVPLARIRLLAALVSLVACTLYVRLRSFLD